MTPSARASILALSVLACTPLIAFAADTQTIVTNVGSEQYIVGRTITLSDDAHGDLTVAGGDITINATVQGSFEALGGNITVSGDVRHNMRAVGGSVEIDHIVGGNLVVLGGNVRVMKDATIGGSVFVLGGNVTIDGTVEGDVQLKGGNATLNGAVYGNADIRTKQATVNGQIGGNAVVSALSLTITPQSSVSGTLHYWSNAGQQNFTTVAHQGATFDDSIAMQNSSVSGATSAAAILAALTFFTIFSAALAIAIFLLLTKTLFKDSSKYLSKQIGTSFLIGLLYFVLTPIVIVVLFLTVIGIPLAAAVLLLFVISILFSKILTSIVLARYVEMYYKKKWTFWPVFFVSIGIYIALKVLAFIPIVGWLAVIFCVLISYGALIHSKYLRFQKVR